MLLPRSHKHFGTSASVTPATLDSAESSPQCDAAAVICHSLSSAMITHHQISHFSPIGIDALSMSTHVQLRRSSSSRPILPSGGRKRLLGIEYGYGPYRLQSTYSLSRQKQQTNPAGIIAMGHQLSIKAHAESYPNLGTNDLPELAHRKSSQQQRIPSSVASRPVSVTHHKAN